MNSDAPEGGEVPAVYVEPSVLLRVLVKVVNVLKWTAIDNNKGNGSSQIYLSDKH